MGDYRLPRDATETRRLDSQGLIYKETLGYLLHPSIPIQEPVRLVDIGCGTGSFIITLAEMLPQSTFVGYDISSEQFPESSTLPRNVELRTHSILDPFPEDVSESFDIATLRLVGQAIPVAQRHQAIDNVVRLVKSGGHIQWTEPDHLEKAYVSAAADNPGTLVPRLFEWSKRNAEQLGWKVETDFGLDLRRLLGDSQRVQAVREEAIPINWSTDPKIRSAIAVNFCGFFRAGLDDWHGQGRGMSDSDLQLKNRAEVSAILQEAETELRTGRAEYVYWIHVVVARIQA